MMLKLDFSKQWVNFIIKYIKYVSYSIWVNRELSPVLFPSMRICQEDPFSLYQFHLSTEGLSLIIKQVIMRGKVYGIQICKRALYIFHLIFTNDNSLLFSKAKMSEVYALQSFLA